MARETRKSHSQGGEGVSAYRGYLITPYVLGEQPIYWVSKGGTTICGCPSYEAAKEAIDSIAS